MAILLAIFAFLADGSLDELFAIQRRLSVQEEKNQESRTRVQALEKQVKGLRSDSRTLEKAARNELAVSGPNEEIYVFDD